MSPFSLKRELLPVEGDTDHFWSRGHGPFGGTAMVCPAVVAHPLLLFSVFSACLPPSLLSEPERRSAAPRFFLIV